MAKRIKREPMVVGDWLVLTNKAVVRNRMATDPYSMAYPALLSHFSGLQTVNWEASVLGLHIVYGWMPTIPKLGSIMQWNGNRRQKLAATLAKAKDGQVPTDDELEMLKAFCNNSMIGASKLLHFLKPETFPIWDARVAKAFLKKPEVRSQQINGVKPWNVYRLALTDWLSNQAVKARCHELRQMAYVLSQVTDLRLVELVMFHKTASKRKLGKN